jgi:hypothetical protein
MNVIRFHTHHPIMAYFSTIETRCSRRTDRDVSQNIQEIISQ